MAKKAKGGKSGNKDHTYTFVIKSEASGSGESGSEKVNPNEPPAPITPAPTQPKPIPTKPQTIASESGGGSGEINWGAKAFVAYETLSDFAKQIASYQLSTISLREGRNELQERAQATYGLAMQGASIAKTMIGGAIVGGGLGAMVGMVAGLTTQAISIYQTGDRMMMQRAVENVGLNMMRIRSGGNRNV